MAKKDLRAAYTIVRKQERQDAVAAVKKKVMAHFFPRGVEAEVRQACRLPGVFKELEAKDGALQSSQDTITRMDGREILKTMRPMVSPKSVCYRAPMARRSSHAANRRHW